MTHVQGQDGRLDFYTQSDDEMKARRAGLMAEANQIVGSRKGKPLDDRGRDRLGQIVTLVKSMDSELAGRAERRGAGDPDPATMAPIDHEMGTIGRPGTYGGASASKSFLTGAAVKAAGQAMADKVVKAREGKSLSAAGGTEVAVVAPGLRPMGRPETVLDVIEVIGASAPSIRYMRQTSRDNNAAVVAAGATKPTSNYGIEPVDRTRKVLAHLSEPIQEYDLLDVPALREFVDTELNFGLMAALEWELFHGDGTAAHLHGFAQESGIQVIPFADDIFSVTRRAVTAVMSLGYTPQVFVLGPQDLERIDLATTSGSGEFVNQAGPFDPAAGKLWGVPTVVSTQAGAKTGYLISQDSVKIYADVAAAVRVQWDRSSDDFETNAIRARLEGRFEIGVGRPEGIVKLATAA